MSKMTLEVSNVDVDLLKEQNEYLYEITLERFRYSLSKEHKDAIQGVIHLIDELLDDAERREAREKFRRGFK